MTGKEEQNIVLPEAGAICPSFRSDPPNAGMRRTSCFSPRSRMKAIKRPSGDQAGYLSTAGSEVSRKGRSAAYLLNVDVEVVQFLSKGSKCHLTAIR